MLPFANSLRPSALIALLGVAASLGLVACGASIGTKQDYSEGVDPVTGEPSSNYSTDARIYGDADEQTLDAGRALARRRDYIEAIEIFEQLSKDPKVEEKYRSEALFSLGEAQGAIFNPNKNYESAILTLKRYLELYPDGDRSEEARTLISNYEQVLEQL